MDDELQVAAIWSMKITELLMSKPQPTLNNNFVEEQRNVSIQEIVAFLECHELPHHEDPEVHVAGPTGARDKVSDPDRYTIVMVFTPLPYTFAPPLGMLT